MLFSNFLHFRQLGDCDCTTSDEKVPSDSDDLNWECVTMQRNLRSFFYAPKRTETETADETPEDELTFFQMVEILTILFVVGNITGMMVFFVSRRIKRNFNGDFKFKLPRILFKKKDDQVLMLDDMS